MTPAVAPTLLARKTRCVGVIQCERHGRQSLAFVSPGVQSAVNARANVSRDHIAAIRYGVFDDDYPPGRAWVEPSVARGIGDRVVAFEELANLELDAVCGECLELWLKANRIEALTPEERRFVRIRTQLSDLLRPRLEPALQAIADSVFARLREPTAFGFQTSRECPFRAHVRRGLRRVLIELRDRPDSLVATAESSLFSTPPPRAIDIGLDYDTLRPSEAPKLVTWAEQVEAWLRRGLVAFDSADR